MPDQAAALRKLVLAREGPAATADPPSARSLVLTSGKGGRGHVEPGPQPGDRAGGAGPVGSSWSTPTSAWRTFDLLCGLAPCCDLGDVLAGDRTLAEAIVAGPGNIRIIPGAHASRTLVEALGDAPRRLVEELSGLEATADFLVVDAGSGLGSVDRHAGGGGRRGSGDRDHARADLSGRRPRRDPAFPPPGGAPTLRAVVNQANSESPRPTRSSRA